MKRYLAAACCVLAGCQFTPEYGDWNVNGDVDGSTCSTFPGLVPQLDVLEADEGFTLALPDGSATAACSLDHRDFACEPLVFEWRHATETEESFLDESLTATGTFRSRDDMSGTLLMGLSCEDDECPNEGDCAVNFTFSAFYEAWFGLG